jgi:hypothetical protein
MPIRPDIQSIVNSSVGMPLAECCGTQKIYTKQETRNKEKQAAYRRHGVLMM